MSTRATDLTPTHSWDPVLGDLQPTAEPPAEDTKISCTVMTCSPVRVRNACHEPERSGLLCSVIVAKVQRVSYMKSMKGSAGLNSMRGLFRKAKKTDSQRFSTKPGEEAAGG